VQIGLNMHMTHDAHTLDVDQLNPGQKQEINLQLNQTHDLIKDVQFQIQQLKKAQARAHSQKLFPDLYQVNNWLDKLQHMEKTLTAKIARLNQGLRLMLIPSDSQVWLKHISAQCSEYIAQVKQAGGWLYRGAEGPPAFQGKSWNNRSPKDSSAAAQHAFDSFLAQLGHVALRGNSIFATSDFDHTREFGSRTYVIFPVNNKSAYTYTNQSDLVLESVSDVGMDRDAMDAYYQELSDHVLTLMAQIRSQPLSDQDAQHLSDLQEFKAMIINTDYGVDWSDVQHGLKIVSQHQKFPDHLLDVNLKDFLDMDIFRSQFSPVHDNLALAIEQELEVFISGVYFALDTQMYAVAIESWFGVPVQSVSGRTW
jgi:hypothetical protein